MRFPWVVGALIACVAVAAPEEPKRSALTESVEKRLVQLDVAVEGDPDAIRNLKAEDFGLYVGEHPVDGLILDKLCGDQPAADTKAPASTSAGTQAPTDARPHSTFVFFFDQTHLTTPGRTRSLETARDLITRLIDGGNRAAIVSSAKRLVTFVPMTGDREKLLAGLERLRDDARQWDSYAATEGSRASLVGGTNYTPSVLISNGGSGGLHPLPSGPCFAARGYAREEWSLVRQTTQRIGMTVSMLADAPAPKALVYFGDTLRQRAGLHYLRLGCPWTEVDAADMTPSASIEIDAAINQAAAQGVHFFTVQAEGLTAQAIRAFDFPGHGGLNEHFPGWDVERRRHAQDTLVLLAVETGGEAFLAGASNENIANRIAALTSCRFLLSFPPGDLPRDKGMNVTLALNVPNVKVRTQGRIVVPSAASLESSRLLAAFVDPVSSDDGSLRALLIPRGGDGKHWKAAIQLRLRPTGLPDNSAELGASIVRKDVATQHFASSIATASGSRAMVLEKSVEITPGEFSVVAVAHDVKRGDIGSTRIEANWPSLAKNAAIAPIAALQLGPAAISKDGQVATTGSIAKDVDELLEPSEAISLASAVCRGASTKDALVIDRRIEGGSRAPASDASEFSPMTIGSSGEPCIQVLDALPKGYLKPGDVADYRIVARIGDEIVAQERRTLRIAPRP